VHDFDRLVPFWNPQPTYIHKGMKYKYNFQYFCQHVIPDIRPGICSSSRRNTPWHIFWRFGNPKDFHLGVSQSFE
jgi:hypothetical protein